MIRKTLVLSWLASSVLLGQSPRIIPGRTSLSADGAVNIAFRLVDANGQPVETLQRDALTVSDNGNPVSGFDLAYRPVSSDEKAYIVLVLDASGSMRFNKKIDNLKRSAINVIDGMSKEDYCAVISFSSHAQLLTGFTNDRTLLKEKVLSITPNGYTAIYDAVFEALNQLDAQPDGQDKLILLISDGEEEGKSLFTLADLIPRIYETKRVRIHTFDLNVKNEVNELRRLAGVSGGSYMYGANSDAVFSAFSGFLRTYRKAYVLSYRPADDPPASHHNVSVCFSVDGIKQQYETEYQGIGQAATMFRTDPDSYLYAGGAAALVAIVGIAGSFAMVRRRKKGYPFAFPQGLRKNSEEPRMAVYPYADQSPDEKTGILDSAGLEGDEE
ncbi:MAG TPA: VWA domain-containing protein, partial [Bacteroidota bacterium]